MQFQSLSKLRSPAVSPIERLHTWPNHGSVLIRLELSCACRYGYQGNLYSVPVELLRLLFGGISSQFCVHIAASDMLKLWANCGHHG